MAIAAGRTGFDLTILVDLPLVGLAFRPPGGVVMFTFRWLDEQRWENADFAVHVINN